MPKKEREKEKESVSLLAQNRKARHDYQILETIECGIALRGTEVKSCRMRSVAMQDSFAKAERNQIFVYNMNISPYSHGNIFNHTPVRPRALLLHKKEILRIARFAASLPGVKEHHLLPYHRLGSDKYAGLGRQYSLPEILPPSNEKMEYLLAVAERAGLNCQIGG